MSPSAVRAAAEYVLAPSGEGRGLLPAQAQPRSSDTDGEAAARTLGSPPTSSRAARDRKDAQGSGRASRTVVRSQTPTRTRTASSTGRQPRRRALSRPEVTDGGREPFFNSTYIEIEVNVGKYLPGRRRGGRTLRGGLKTPSASAPHAGAPRHYDQALSLPSGQKGQARPANVQRTRFASARELHGSAAARLAATARGHLGSIPVRSWRRCRRTLRRRSPSQTQKAFDRLRSGAGRVARSSKLSRRAATSFRCSREDCECVGAPSGVVGRLVSVLFVRDSAKRMTPPAGVFRVICLGGETGAGLALVRWPDQKPVRLVGVTRHSPAACGLHLQTGTGVVPQLRAGGRYGCLQISWTT